MAQWSPLFVSLSIPAYFMFWEYGSLFFFWILLLLGIYIIYDESILKKWIFKKVILLIIFVTWIISFPILENWGVNDTDPDTLWGWVGKLSIIWVWYLLGYQMDAVQISFIVLFLVTLFWIGYTLQIKIRPPQFYLDIQKNPKTTSSNKKQKINNTEKLQPTQDLSKSTTNEQITAGNKEPSQASKSIIGSLLKQKVQDKFDEKIYEKEQEKMQIRFPEDKPSFDISFLQAACDPSEYEIDEKFLEDKSFSIQKKLEEFWMPISIEWYDIWPTVIQIKIKPQAWIKLSKIENLKKDLALSLKTKSLRVIAPIPGTEFVGIEIPNPKPQVVTLRETLWSAEFGDKISKSLTNLTLWKWIKGDINVKPLEKMPHLLVAGATWSGKSVWINDFIMSLIYQNNPTELKFIMVDPKQVELWIYDWIPYLLSPIITEPEKAVKVLKRVVEFMNIRYKNLKKMKVRNIDQYNKKVQKEEKMYRLVVIIDELADLMMSGSKKDTENYIARIAQMARAVWIHLIVATQRPSVNVITWVIKANIPTRIAFGVVSIVDSRTILDSKWAEDLVGKWDMLYMDPTTKFPIRIQAPFVDTDETELVVSKIKEKYMKWLDEKQIYHPEIINILESKPERGTGWGGGDDDELVQEAIQIISETKKASATMLQRKLWIWFARAAKIMDILEEQWVVWPAEWAKPRDIYV